MFLLLLLLSLLLLLAINDSGTTDVPVMIASEISKQSDVLDHTASEILEANDSPDLVVPLVTSIILSARASITTHEHTTVPGIVD